MSLMLTSLLNVTHPRLNHLRSGWGSAMAARKNPLYRRHIWKTEYPGYVDEIYIIKIHMKRKRRETNIGNNYSCKGGKDRDQTILLC